MNNMVYSYSTVQYSTVQYSTVQYSIFIFTHLMIIFLIIYIYLLVVVNQGKLGGRVAEGGVREELASGRES
jgi:hypothetical protein